MIKKSKDFPQQIAEIVKKTLEYNKENPQSPIKVEQVEISKGLYNCGSVAIRNKVCEALGRKPWDSPFIVKVHYNDCNHFLLITYE